MSATYHIKNNKNDVHKRSTVADMLSPTVNKPTKNHMRDNLKIIKITEQQNKIMKQREIDEIEASKDLYKLPQFKKVSPRLYENNVNTDDIPDVGQRNFLTKNTSQIRQNELKEERKQIRNQMDEELQLSKIHDLYRKPELPKASSSNMNRESSQNSFSTNKDFISQNKNVQQYNANSNNNNASSAPESKHEFYGKVPDYLAERKFQKEYNEEMRKLNAPDPDCPPGMIKISEEDRLETLNSLKANRAELYNTLSRMPFVCETPTQKKRMTDLEAKIREIESAIGIFNRPKVFVAK